MGDSAVSLFESALRSGHHLLFFKFLLGNFFGSCFSGAWDGNFFFRKDDFYVTGRSHVGVDATVSTVGSAALFGSSVDLDSYFK